MRGFIRFSLFLVILFTFQFCAVGQYKQMVVDVLQLKQGGIVKGQITQIVPNSVIRIKTIEGSIYEFNMEEIKSIDKDTLYVKNDNQSETQTIQYIQIPDDPSDSDPMINNSSTSLNAGLAIPLSDFADQNNGMAKTGFAMGFNYASRGELGGLLCINYAYNSISVENRAVTSTGSWSTFWAMGGLKIGTRSPSGNNFYCGPLLGFCIASSPSVGGTGMVSTSTYPYYTYADVTQESASSVAFAYGGVISINANHLQFGLLYSYCEPEFEAGITANAAGYGTASDKTKFKQKITILHLTIGYHF